MRHRDTLWAFVSLRADRRVSENLLEGRFLFVKKKLSNDVSSSVRLTSHVSSLYP